LVLSAASAPEANPRQSFWRAALVYLSGRNQFTAIYREHPSRFSLFYALGSRFGS
jgi:hypothetical protein